MILLRQQSPFCFPGLISILASLSIKQPLKHLPIAISCSEISIGSLDDTQLILIGVQIPSAFFSAFICQKPKILLMPLSRLSKILSLNNQQDSSINIQYEEGEKVTKPESNSGKQEIKIRIHSLKNDEKVVVHLPIRTQFGEMISQKYEEPLNVIQYIKGLEALPEISISNFQNENKKIKLCCKFKFSCMEFIRICGEFLELTPRLIVSYQSEVSSNKKYLTFSSETQQGLKSIVLSQQKTQLETLGLQEAVLLLAASQFMDMPQKVQFSDVFDVSSLFKIALISKNNQKIFDEDVTIFMEKDKGFFAQFLLKNGGAFVALVASVQ